MSSPSLPFLEHQAVFARLLQSFRARRLPHALLFTGPEGIGKRQLALHFSRILLCSSSQEPCLMNTADPAPPAFFCASCHLSDLAKHPDFFLLAPEQSRIKIDAIRQLKHPLSLAPLLGQARVILIDDAHALNSAAANALLKTLEEPPPDTYFILVTHAPGWLPKTVVSRCQKVRFSPLAEATLQRILQAKGLAVPERLEWAQGSALRALQWAESDFRVPAVDSLRTTHKTFSVTEAHAWVQSAVEADRVSFCLDTLFADAHQTLLQPQGDFEDRFDLLTFADKIGELRHQLRQNANPKIHLLRLLLHFREKRESRL